jgi:putative ABC transport system permease protein
VVGVLPARVGPLEEGRDLFVPARWLTPPRKGPFFVFALGRLATGDDLAAAEAELEAINRRIFPRWRDSYQDERATWGAVDLKEQVVGEDAGTRLGLLLGAVALVLVIAATNAANLLIARAAHRQRELSMRGVLGATRARLLQHLLAESGLLAAGACAVGLGLAAGGVRLLAAASTYIPRAREIELSGPALVFLAAATLTSALLFGLVPALVGARSRSENLLLAGGRGATPAAGARRLRRAMVAAQFAVATPLLITSALLLASLGRLRDVDPGFRPDGVLTAALLLPAERYRDAPGVASFWERLEREVEALPGVEGVAFADGRPPNEVGNLNNFDVEDDPTPRGESEPTAPWVSVSPAYFELMGIPLLAGRPFDPRDAADDAPQVVIVDRAWAGRFFPGEEVIGRRLREGGGSTWATVVGVVGEVKYLGLDQPDQGTVYWPIAQRSMQHPIETATPRFRFLIVRAALDPATVLPAIRGVVRHLDPELPLTQVAALEELLSGSLEVQRLVSALVAAFAAAALVLSLVAVYGVMSYFVQQHTREIGIRLALGGPPAAVRRLVVGHGMRMVGVGVAIGVAAALGLSRLLASQLYEVEATDPRAFAGVAAAMLAVALGACLVPARRAAAVDPATTLRAE